MTIHVKGFTLAVRDMVSMVKFYQEVFSVEFQQIEAFHDHLYQGKFGELNLLLCPASVAGNNALENRHQFDIEVDDLKTYKDSIVQYGGRLMDQNNSDESLAFYDPDGNSMVLIQSPK